MFTRESSESGIWAAVANIVKVLLQIIMTMSPRNVLTMTHSSIGGEAQQSAMPFKISLSWEVRILAFQLHILLNSSPMEARGLQSPGFPCGWCLFSPDDLR